MTYVVEILNPKAGKILRELEDLKLISIAHKKHKKLADDLSEAFQNVKEHESGKRKLKTARQFLDEL